MFYSRVLCEFLLWKTRTRMYLKNVVMIRHRFATFIFIIIDVYSDESFSHVELL